MTTVAGTALIAVAAYLVGGVPTGLLVLRVTRPGIDIRRLGTGNTGASNIYRNVGPRLAAAVGPLQFGQGLLCVALVRGLGGGTPSAAVAGVAAVVGNQWPVWTSFQGGRGVAVGTGAVAGLGVPGLIALLASFAVGALRREIALGVIVGFVVLPAVEFVVLGGSGASFGLALLALIVLRRLEGVGRDRGVSGADRARVLCERILHDRRPGQRLVGPRIEPEVALLTGGRASGQDVHRSSRDQRHGHE